MQNPLVTSVKRKSRIANKRKIRRRVCGYVIFYILHTAFLIRTRKADQSAIKGNTKLLYYFGAVKRGYQYDGYVFVDEMGERMKANYLTSRFPEFLEKKGLRRMRFHDLRHSCASLLLANGVPLKHIQEWLGHSDFSTTANIYAHLDYSAKITSAQAMESGLQLPEAGGFTSRWSNGT